MSDSQVALVVTGAIAILVTVGGMLQERWRANRDDRREFHVQRLTTYARLSESCTEFVSQAENFVPKVHRVGTGIRAAVRPIEARDALRHMYAMDETVGRINSALAMSRLVASSVVVPHLDRMAEVALAATELVRSSDSSEDVWAAVVATLKNNRQQFEASVRQELTPPEPVDPRDPKRAKPWRRLRRK
jgi:hypothetical protein